MTEVRRPLRVLHLRDSPWIDGPGRTILETASSIDRTRIDYQIGVFVSASGSEHPLVTALRGRALPVHEIVDDGKSMRKVAQQVVALIDELKIDILHTSEFRSNIIGLMCRRNRAVRLVSTAHGWIANDLRGKLKCVLDRILLRRFDRVIVVSEAMRRRLARWWVSNDRLRVVHNALVFERFKPDSRTAPRPMLDPLREFTLLSVGRLSPEKGQLLLLRAVAALATEHPNLRVAFAGSGPLEPELRRLAAKLGIADRVRLLGYLSDMKAAYCDAALVIQSSFTEGLPNVILEAAFVGVPIVATDVGGTAEVIEHNISGWLIKPYSCKELVDGIQHYLQHPAHFADMARAAREKVLKEFSFAARTTGQLNVYAELGRSAT